MSSSKRARASRTAAVAEAAAGAAEAAEGGAGGGGGGGGEVGRLVDCSQADDRRMIRLVRERRLLYARNNMPVASYYSQVKKLWEQVAREMGWTGRYTHYSAFSSIITMHVPISHTAFF